MIIPPAHRTETVREYYFSVKNREIAALNAERTSRGEKPVINLGIGSPDGTPPREALKTLSALAVSAGKLREARRENDQLKTEIETVKLMSRAKLILMQHFGMTEKEAHKYIEQRAMESRSSRRAIAENIIKGLDIILFKAGLTSGPMGLAIFSDAFTFALLIIIIVVKPTGLFGEKSIDKV